MYFYIYKKGKKEKKKKGKSKERRMSYVLNKKTNRMVKVGGKIYKRLMKEGLIPDLPSKFQEGGVPKIEKKGGEELVEELVKNPVKVNNFKKGEKKEKEEKLAEYAAQCTRRTLNKHIDDLNNKIQKFSENGEDEDSNNQFIDNLEKSVKDLILKEMIQMKIPQSENQIPQSEDEEYDFELPEEYF